MAVQFVPVADADTLEQVFERSQQQPVVLFKHDTMCPISARAYKELSQLECEIPLVEVDHAHDISREVATRTGVQHQSPQVILLRNGRSVWSASLFDITSDAVGQASRMHA